MFAPVVRKIFLKMFHEVHLVSVPSARATTSQGDVLNVRIDALQLFICRPITGGYTGIVGVNRGGFVPKKSQPSRYVRQQMIVRNFGAEGDDNGDGEIVPFVHIECGSLRESIDAPGDLKYRPLVRIKI